MQGQARSLTSKHACCSVRFPTKKLTHRRTVWRSDGSKHSAWLPTEPTGDCVMDAFIRAFCAIFISTNSSISHLISKRTLVHFCMPMSRIIAIVSFFWSLNSLALLARFGHMTGEVELKHYRFVLVC